MSLLRKLRLVVLALLLTPSLKYNNKNFKNRSFEHHFFTQILETDCTEALDFIDLLLSDANYLE